MNTRRLVLGAVLLAFSGLTAWASAAYGVRGIIEGVTANGVSVLLFTDLTIALGLIMLWMWQDARDRSVSPLPYVALTLLFGSVGPLLYLFRREAGDGRVLGVGYRQPIGS
jgi:hypothetical protein